MIFDPLGRENYVRLICQGYLLIGKPIPEEFWDEWEVIAAKDAKALSAEQKLLEIPPIPMEVYAVMHDGSEFQLLPDGPSRNNSITLRGTVPKTGILWYFQLRREDGTLLAQFDGNLANAALVGGDSLTCMLDAEQMLKLIAP